MTITQHVLSAVGQDATSREEAADRGIDALRAETRAVLDGLDAAAKGRASIVRSCSEIKGLDCTERDGLKDLLRCITEQRKRLRALRRLWQSLDVFERPSAGLVEATELCIRESGEIASALDPWRLHTIGQVAVSVSATWTHLARAASQFSKDVEPAAANPAPSAIRTVS
jgi:hypothetical protein